MIDRGSRRAAALWVALALGCNGKKNVPEASAAPSTAAPTGTATAPIPMAVSGDGHLLVSKPHLAVLKKRAAAGDKTWKVLLENVEAHMQSPEGDRTGAENLAIVHLVTGDPRHCQAALAFAREGMKADVRGGSYLYYGDHMREVAMVLDACRESMSAGERKVLADYLERWTEELWFDNQGSGWGLDDPGNNYMMAFLEGTAFAGYALKDEKRPSGDKFLALLHEKLEKRVFPYLESRGRGGDWHEGVNYGQRSKQRLFDTLAVIASKGGPNHFNRPFVRDAVLYAIYQLQPDLESIYPGGDLARDSSMKVSPLDRDYILMAVHFSSDTPTRRRGKWYLERVVPSMSQGDFAWRQGLYRDFLFASPDVEPLPPGDLPTGYRAEGTSWVNLRSGWDRDATSLSIAASPVVDQSHAHFDTGSFTIFKGGWQALDAATLSRSGLPWEAGAHNMVTVEGHERRVGPAGGLLAFEHRPKSHAYAQIDASKLFRTRDGGDAPMLEEYTRELVFFEPNRLVVFDRVTPKGGARYHLRLHVAESPQKRGKLFTARNGQGSLAYAVLVGGESRVAPDSDLAQGESGAHRIETHPGDKGRFLTVIEVASGPPPSLEARSIESDGKVAGALVGDQVVVFSDAARGAPVGAFAYTVPGRARRTHVLVNLTPEAGYTVSVKKSGDTTRVEVSPGGETRASAEGVLRLEG